MLPRFANAVLLLKGLPIPVLDGLPIPVLDGLPVPVLDRVADLFGIASTMDHLTGRTAR